MAKQLIFGSVATVIGAGIIYLSFRPGNLLVFQWLSTLSLETELFVLRSPTLKLIPFLPDWFLYSLPDGLWLFSCQSLLLWIWRNEIQKENFFWLSLLPSIAIFWELGQLSSIISGTFDILDIVFYLLGAILPLLIYSTSFTLNIQENEKSF